MSEFSPLVQFLLLTVAPALGMFLLERGMIRWLVAAPWGKEWVIANRWLHPNSISRARYPMGMVAVALFHAGNYLPGGLYLWQHLGIYCFTFWIISDITDGSIARHFDLHTEEGKSIDPLSDKLLLFPPLFYFAWLGRVEFFPVVFFLIFDVFGQASRNFIKNKAANLFGKAKTFLCVITIVLLTIQEVYWGGETWPFAVMTLWTSAILAFFSMFFKIVPRYWYANILSLLNFSCGLAGIYLTLFHQRPDLAFALVFAGQFLDLFDGRAAEKWGSTPRGELLDDLADGTNFGGTIAVIIFYSLGHTETALALSVLHFTTTAYRLIRFLRNKRKAGVKGGVHLFQGLPSPAGALIAGSIALSDAPLAVKILVILANSGLMISKIPYIHFGRVILPGIPKLVLVILLTCTLLGVMLGFASRNLQILYWMVFASGFAYLAFGIPWRGTKPPAPPTPKE